MTTTTAPTITLSKTAPWASEREIAANPQLRNGYRERFAFVDGRMFRAEAKHLNDLWWVEEVEHDGHPAADALGTFEMRLSDVRARIAEWVQA